MKRERAELAKAEAAAPEVAVERHRARLKALNEKRNFAMGEGRIDDVIAIEEQMSATKKLIRAALAAQGQAA